MKTPDDPATVLASGTLCFGCGPDNANGLRLQFTIDTDGEGTTISTAATRIAAQYEGPPGFVHGGIIATLLDKAMSKVNRPLRVIAMTRHMEVDYLRPVPVETKLTIQGQHVRRDGRKLFNAAQILDMDGHVLAKAKGVFVVVDPAKIAGRAQRLAVASEANSSPA